jgi:phosphate uptake regulator
MFFPGGKMDFRKIIAFGKSSFVISLPKSWLETHKLKRGDVVFLEQESDKLVLMPKEKEEQKEEKKAFINTDGKDAKMVRREIISAFLNYNDYLVIEGKNMHRFSDDIKRIIHNLMAFEIIEQSGTRIVAKDFLKVGDIIIKDYFRRADIIVRSMIKDLIDEQFTSYGNIAERKDSVNRVYLLILKLLKAVLSNISLMKKIDLKGEEIITYYRACIALQKTASFIQFIASNIADTSLKYRQNLREMLKELNAYYINVMKAFYAQDIEKAYSFSHIRDEAVEKISSSLSRGAKQEILLVEQVINAYFELHEILHRIYS